MSLTPDPTLAAPDPPPFPAGIETSALRRRQPSFPFVAIALALFTFAVGLFLMVFPWTEDWNVNAMQQISSRVQELWNQDSFRGAFTGLGLVNIYIACLQIARLFRRS